MPTRLLAQPRAAWVPAGGHSPGCIDIGQERQPRPYRDDLLVSVVGVAGFEPTASSSRTRIEGDDQHQQVWSRTRGSRRQVLWW
jgi:hypothetical protein